MIYSLQIGAAYNKDAYVQNELVLAALKTATDHLVQGKVTVMTRDATSSLHVFDIIRPFLSFDVMTSSQVERFVRRCTDPLTTMP